MRVVVAPDSFKGTYSAGEVASAIAAGLVSAGAEAVPLPVADGGEGTVDVLSGPLGLSARAAASRNPWGAECPGSIALSRDGAAFVELASVCGITTPHDGVRDPVTASTYGVGMLMIAAARAGAREVVVAAGGSATSDGGAGALRAIRAAGGLPVPVTVLTDVTTPYRDAARVFGPQKGADPAQVEVLTSRLRAVASALPRDPWDVPGTGAAGGFAGAMWAFGASLVPGAGYVLDALNFDAQVASAQAVVVGEGRLDGQSTQGKIVSAVLARSPGVNRFAVVGSLGPGAETIRDEFTGVLVASTPEKMRAAGRVIAGRLRPGSGRPGRA
ncbi:glycerate kinase [Amycolatopsis sp. NPDC006125]|uniref:glycerate kinase family protein n=1 Tax=Amycolatopsis sp. NPDC006125 TaxID=3156730 RepID=UPI0033A59EFE